VGMRQKIDEHLKAGLQARVDGPLQAYSVAQPVGTMSHFLRAEATNVAVAGAGGDARMSGRTRGSASSGGKRVKLPNSFAVAITPTTVHVFGWKNFWTKVTVKRELLTLPRAGLRVAVTPKGSTTFFHLRSEPSGEELAFEMATLGFASAKARVEEVVTALQPEGGADDA